ncbi:MAG: trypsin-like peptidase domain-containing protein [Nostocoides sp.]
MTDLHQPRRMPHEPSGSGTTPLWFGEATHNPSDAAYDVHSTQELPAGPHAPALAPVRTEPVPPGKVRRTAELTAVALLAALLASGGTYAATRMDSTDALNPSIAQSSSNPGRGTTSAPVVQANPQAPNWTATAAAVSPSVVAITVETASGQAQGSGVILDSSGNILTNNHVVDGATTVTVGLNDGRSFKATIRGTDPSTDLAVVRLTSPPSGLTPVAVGDSENLKVGDPVMAIGNPLGLAGTVTTGIVSALNRPVTTGGQSQQDPTNPFGQPQRTTEQVVTNAIQTSAAINPGNSGGALVNAAGQLVGINSAIASLSSGGGQAGSIGIGFAIPVREAKAIADQLIANGAAQHAYLGVGTQDGTASDGTADRSGAKITSVAAGTPAAAAGIKAGDLVIAVDGQLVDSADSLIANVRERTVGETVKITAIRDGKTLDLQTKLVTRPATSQ